MMLSNEWLNYETKILKHLAMLSGDPISKMVAKKALAICDSLGTTDINLIKDILRADENDMSEIISAKRLLNNVCYVVSAPFAPAGFSIYDGYYGVRQVTNIPTLIEEVHDIEHNIFYASLKKIIKQFEEYDVVGISFTGTGQLVMGSIGNGTKRK